MGRLCSLGKAPHNAIPARSAGKRLWEAEIYDRAYFLRHCGGHEAYAQSKGGRLDARLAIVLELADIQPGLRTLDLGCGRGELVRHAAEKGDTCWGVDLSADALALSRETLLGAPREVRQRAALSWAGADHLPFPDGVFHRVILSDILEHLTPPLLKATLAEVHRVLRPGGRLVFHTFPNRWFYAFHYRLKRLLWDLPRGKAGPSNPRTPHERAMHVNELSPLALLRALRPLFTVRLWCAHRDHWDPQAGRFRRGSRPIDWLREPEIWGVARRRADAD